MPSRWVITENRRKRIYETGEEPAASDPAAAHADDAAEIAIRLLDDAYRTWVVAKNECGLTFDLWSDGPTSRRTAAYFTYRAALDREEAAARDLQRLSELAKQAATGSAGTRRAIG